MFRDLMLYLAITVSYGSVNLETLPGYKNRLFNSDFFVFSSEI